MMFVFMLWLNFFADMTQPPWDISYRCITLWTI